MQRFFCGLFLALTQAASAQLHDDFSDGDFTENPAWIGDSASFLVEEGWLRSAGPEATSTLFLSTELPVAPVREWRFRLRLDFDPSSSNYARVYLASDQPDLEASLNGYFLQLGEASATVSDTLDLYRQDGLTLVKVLTSVFPCIGSASTNIADVQVLRDSMGMWQLWADCEQTGTYVFAAEALDAEHAPVGWFGFYARYSTASRAASFFLDNVYAGSPIIDSVAPALLALQTLSDRSLLLDFSEAVDPESAAATAAYTMNNGLGNPAWAARSAEVSTQVELEFSSPFLNGISHTLTVNGVHDLAGNAMLSASLDFVPYRVQPLDVVISEIFPDPSPSGGGLPEAEYAELLNHSGQAIDLQGWTLRDASASRSSGFASFMLPAGGRVIVCDVADTALFEGFGAVLGVSGFPSLNNDADALSLLTEQGVYLHTINYTTDWYRNATKAEGGWSLEMIDAQRPHLGGCNWRASTAAAQGTPGLANSVANQFQDEEVPVLVGAAVVDPSTIRALFSESMDSLSLLAGYVLSPDLGVPLAVVPEGPDFASVKLLLPEAVQLGTVYTLALSGAVDCAGNAIAASSSTLFGVPEVPDSLDLVINEILFNPKTGGADYIEVLNRSSKIVEMFNLFVAELDPLFPSEKLEVARVSPEGRLLFPGQYVVLTEDPEAVLLQFFSGSPSGLLRVRDMPAWSDSDKEGIVLLEYRDGAYLRSLDRVHFNESWHFALLDDTEGVSLERIDPDQPSQRAFNWHSAAQGRGFGTPADPNSVFFAGSASGGGMLSLEPEVFSPDQDGFEDVLRIRVTLGQPGFVVSIRLFDDRGWPVRQLVRSQSAGLEEVFTWDGTTDLGERAPVGIYLVWVEAFDLEGNMTRETGRCVLARKLR
ncbi:MAG: hypothetical protein GC205_05340 [Bacteroidetes bacterium]|nr:hypothetical protein [Bacteroidota bacterium]